MPLESFPIATSPVSSDVASFLEAANNAAARTALGLGTLATQSGTFSGTSSGTNTGDQTSVSGNAGTATALQTARNINGVPFNGTANITVGAALDDITGLGTGVGTALAVNVGSAGAPVVNGGALGTPSSGNLSNCTTDGTNLVGYRGAPQNSQSTAYTTVLSDAGKCIFHPSSDNNARTFTIDSNANVAFPIGTIMEFLNMAAADVTIAITSDTLTLLPDGTTGSRTLAQYGRASAEKISSTAWVISGNSALT